MHARMSVFSDQYENYTANYPAWMCEHMAVAEHFGFGWLLKTHTPLASTVKVALTIWIDCLN